jgi:hypothetical protein
VLAGFTGQLRSLASVVTLSPGDDAAARAPLEAWARECGASAALWSRRRETPRHQIEASRT